MRPEWRLAINSLSGRRRRTGLLVGAVALSATLIVVVSCAIASINRALIIRMEGTVGRADLQVRNAGDGKGIPASLVDVVRGWPEMESASPRVEASIALTGRKMLLMPGEAGGFIPTPVRVRATALAQGLDEGGVVNRPPLLAGRWPEREGEIVLDAFLAQLLSGVAKVKGERLPIPSMNRRRSFEGENPALPPTALSQADADAANRAQVLRVGESLELVRQMDVVGDLRLTLPSLAPPLKLAVVGVCAQPPLGGRAQAYMTMEALGAIAGGEGEVQEILVRLREGVEAAEVARVRQAELPPGVLVQTTARITSGLDRNMRSSELGFVLASILAFLSASFIVLTGLTSGIAERQRELAIMRCIGAERGQLAGAQLVVGAIIGGLGGLLGIPLGLAIAWALALFFRDRLPTGLAIAESGLVLAATGAVGAGLIGGIWPAVMASRVSPLRALGARAAAPRMKWMLVALGGALACIGFQLAVVGIPDDGQVAFWLYATAGLPLMFLGYFVLGAPVTLALAGVLAPAVSRVLGLPPRVLRRTIAATPYRFGLTAGAMMGGMALMIAIWTNGGAILRDWLDRLEFPDAFVTGLNLTQESQAKLDALPFVENTCAITLHRVETDLFGVRALQKYQSTFMAFEPERFFAMTNLTWVEGEREEAIRRLNGGGCVLVSREFLVARGLGVGDTFRCVDAGKEHEFEIVGVVTSPGLDVVSKFFNIGREYAEQSVHAVFGSREDLRTRFGSDAIHLIQIALTPEADERQAISKIYEELFGAGILDAGSGRRIKDEIKLFARRMLMVFSAVAGVAMLVACFGVANLIVAGIESRRFEFGVLLAVGAKRSLLTRLVLGEAVLIATAAGILGTLMGVQASWAGQRLQELLMGMLLELRPPLGALAAGWGVVFVMTLGAAAPAAWRIGRRRPRELLASVRG